MHEVEALVDFLQREDVGDHRINLDLAVHIPVDDLGHVGPSLGAAKGRALPHAAGDELERAGADFPAGFRDADDDALAPALVATFKCLTHYLHITDALKTVINSTTRHINNMLNYILNIIGVNKRGKKAEGCSKIITIDKIDSVLPGADFLYLALPETPETKNLIDKKRLDMLKPTCGIVNIGRQSVMDYDVLSEKLKKKEIAGAILDVFTLEPLEKNSKLWDVPNLVITPHVSSDDNGSYVKLTLNIFLNNLKLFIENKELNNQIDKKLGY